MSRIEIPAFAWQHIAFTYNHRNTFNSHVPWPYWCFPRLCTRLVCATQAVKAIATSTVRMSARTQSVEFIILRCNFVIFSRKSGELSRQQIARMWMARTINQQHQNTEYNQSTKQQSHICVNGIVQKKHLLHTNIYF